MLAQLPIALEDTTRSHAEAVARNRIADERDARVAGLRSAISMYEAALSSGVCPFSKEALTPTDRTYFQNAIKQWSGELSRLNPAIQ